MKRLLLILCLLVAYASPAEAAWRRAESPHFIVYSEESEPRLRERILLLEDYDRLLRTLTTVSGEAAPVKLHVYVVRGSDDLQKVRPGLGRIVGGFYTATPYGIAAFVDDRASMGGRRSENEILFHEYAHHFMMQYAPTAYPAWYIEGFAEYYMTARFSERSIEFGNFSEARAYQLDPAEWLPMERVLFGTTGMGERQRSYFYAQSWLIVHYFFSTPERQAAIRRYLAALAGGGEPAEAFRTATGLTPAGLRDELRRYIAGRRITYHRIERSSTDAPPPVTVATLPRSADDLLLYEAALKVGPGEDYQPTLLQRIRSAAVRHPADPYGRRVLAHAELLIGDPAAADRLLDPLLAAAPQDAELMYLKGMRHLVAAQKEDWEGQAHEARRWFARAHRADANHFQTLYRYAETLQRSRDYTSENTRNVLLLAYELAPQVAEVGMNAALLLMRRGEFDPAARLLRPLAAAAHNEELAGAARELLRQAEARERPGDAPPEDDTGRRDPAPSE